MKWLIFLATVSRQIQRLGTEIRREAALSKREIKYTVGFRGDKKPRNPQMFE